MVKIAINEKLTTLEIQFIRSREEKIQPLKTFPGILLFSLSIFIEIVFFWIPLVNQSSLYKFIVYFIILLSVFVILIMYFSKWFPKSHIKFGNYKIIINLSEKVIINEWGKEIELTNNPKIIIGPNELYVKTEEYLLSNNHKLIRSINILNWYHCPARQYCNIFNDVGEKISKFTNIPLEPLIN